MIVWLELTADLRSMGRVCEANKSSQLGCARRGERYRDAREMTYLRRKPLEPPIVLLRHTSRLKPLPNLLDPLRYASENSLVLSCRRFEPSLAAEVEQRLGEEGAHFGGFVGGEKEGLAEGGGSVGG